MWVSPPQNVSRSASWSARRMVSGESADDLAAIMKEARTMREDAPPPSPPPPVRHLGASVGCRTPHLLCFACRSEARTTTVATHRKSCSRRILRCPNPTSSSISPPRCAPSRSTRRRGSKSRSASGSADVISTASCLLGLSFGHALCLDAISTHLPLLAAAAVAR